MKFKPQFEKAFYEKIQSDAAFKQNLLNNPNQTIKQFLKECGLKEDPSCNYKIHIEKANEAMVVIPHQIIEAPHLSAKELEKISGGTNCGGCSPCS